MSDTTLDRIDRYCDLRERAIDAAEERGTACIDECALLGVHELRALIAAAREAERQYAVVAELRAQLEAMTDMAKRRQERIEWLEAHEEDWRNQHLRDTKMLEPLADKIERLRLRELTREEMEAALGDKAETFYDGWTVRRCIDCRTPVAGGPTRCWYCAGKFNAAEASALLRAFVADFCDVAEMAATAHETGGMRVPYHGDFCSAAPSVRRDLAAWAKRGREVMGTKP